jgi:polyhydroxyalkanoate synthesis regulator phasin
MLELLKKGFYTGLGLALVTKEKAEELAKELVKKGELSEKEGKGFVEEILKKSKEAEKEFEKKAETLVNNAIKKIDVPSKKEFIAITQRLAKLEGEIEDLKKKIVE